MGLLKAHPSEGLREEGKRTGGVPAEGPEVAKSCLVVPSLGALPGAGYARRSEFLPRGLRAQRREAWAALQKKSSSAA